MILAIDTSGSIATIALGNNEGLISEYHFAHNMDLLRRLTPAIEHIISDAQSRPSELTGIVASLGPGSFTGLRIGITAAKTLAWSLNVPLVGVSTLEAIARSNYSGGCGKVCAMIYSRTGEVYWAVYDAAKGYVQDASPAVSNIEDVAEYIRSIDAPVFCCGSGATKNEEFLRSAAPNIRVLPDWTSFARGAVLLDIGRRKINSGEFDDPLSLCPLYIKKPTPVVRKESALRIQPKDE